MKTKYLVVYFACIMLVVVFNRWRAQREDAFKIQPDRPGLDSDHMRTQQLEEIDNRFIESSLKIVIIALTIFMAMAYFG